MADKTEQIKKIAKKSPNPELITGAFEFAKELYKEKKRLSGENYLDHGVRVATILDSMNLDPQVIAAGLLHDALDDLPQSVKNKELKELESKFGKEVAFFVERNPEIHKIRYPFLGDIKEKVKLTQERFEDMQKMFFALAGDVRVVLIELASRIDNLNSLAPLSKEKQKIYALETLKIFAPVADKLGIWELKHRLEDLSFFYLFPDKFREIGLQIKEKSKERKHHLKSLTNHIKKLLKKNGVGIISIDSRAKSYWSTYKKLLKHNNDIEKVHDLLALRIIVNTVENCYKTLGIIHKRWRPLFEEIDDYIAKPKPNGYRSLHTTIFSEDGHITEIQIRTLEMHKEAEYGICAHWAYKQKIDLAKNRESLDFTKEIPEIQKRFKIDFYENKVFAFTPRGDIISLTRGSTPIDFAYAVHSEIGNHCETAKINEKVVSLSEPIKSGDVVEIIVNNKRKPSMDWLKIVKTNLAISQIRKELAKNGLSARIAALGKIPSIIKRTVLGIAKREEKPQKERKLELYLAGQKGMSTTMAKCCNPKPGDDVSAYLSRCRAAVVHKSSCKELKKLAKKSPEKIIEASWKK